MVTVRNKFDTLQEISERHTPNDEYKNFITALIEMVAECTLTKSRAKCRVPRESIAVYKKKQWDDMKKEYLLHKSYPTNVNMLKL